MNSYLKRLILLGIIYAIFFGGLVNSASAFKFVISNRGPEKVVLSLDWWDHKLDHYGPFRLHVGEYDAKEVHALDSNYSGRLYSVSVEGDLWGYTRSFDLGYTVPPETVVIIWDGCRVTHEMK